MSDDTVPIIHNYKRNHVCVVRASKWQMWGLGGGLEATPNPKFQVIREFLFISLFKWSWRQTVISKLLRLIGLQYTSSKTGLLGTILTIIIIRVTTWRTVVPGLSSPWLFRAVNNHSSTMTNVVKRQPTEMSSSSIVLHRRNVYIL